MPDTHEIICDYCTVAMKWSRTGIAQKSPLVLRHTYQCPTCDRVAETRAAVGEAPEPVTFFGRSSFTVAPSAEKAKLEAA